MTEGKHMKRKLMVVILVTILMCLAGTEYVLAATGVSEAEQTILDKMKAGVEVNGKVVHMPVSYINQAENELIKNEVDLTSEQAAVINQKIEEAMEIVKTISLKDLTEMRKPEAVFKLIKIVDEAAAEIDYKVSIDFRTMALNITNPKGDTVFVSKNSINQTGFDYTATALVGIVLLGVFFLCLILAIRCKIVISHQIKFLHYLRKTNQEGLGTNDEV
jgi:hypothetical protein